MQITDRNQLNTSASSANQKPIRMRKAVNTNPKIFSVLHLYVHTSFTGKFVGTFVFRDLRVLQKNPSRQSKFLKKMVPLPAKYGMKKVSSGESRIFQRGANPRGR